MEKVSVIIPTYNRSSTIKRAVESVIKQTYKNLEIIIIDDASTDDTSKIIKKIPDDRIIYKKLRKNKGACFARNKGIDISTGEYITFQDSDDYYLEEKIERQIKNLKKNKSDIDFCKLKLFMHDKEIIIPSDIKQLKFEKYGVNEELFNGNFISTQAILMKRSIAKKTMFDNSFPRLQDYDFILRATSISKTSFTNEILVYLYNQKDSISNDENKMLKALDLIAEKTYTNNSILKKALDDYITQSKLDIQFRRKIEECKQLREKLEQKDIIIKNLSQELEKYKNIQEAYNNILNSKSWKITQPLRDIMKKIKKDKNI